MLSQLSAFSLFLFIFDVEAQNIFLDDSLGFEEPIANSKLCTMPTTCFSRNISYYILTRQNNNPYIVNHSDGEDVIIKAPFVPGYPLKVIAPGLDGTSYHSNRLINLLIPAYYRQPSEFNIIVIKYPEQIALSGFICALQFASVDGECLAKFLVKIYKYFPDFKLENTHIIGGSYGGVVAAYTGNLFDGALHRITALDPPDILRSVHTEDISYPLCQKSAKIVDVLHGNMGYLGHWSMLGKVDVIFNSGIIQPGIDKGKFSATLSSHVRLSELYSLSIVYNRSFLARRCKYSIYEYFIGQSDHLCPLTGDPEYHIVGESMSPDLEGTFLVCTSGKFPYVLGEYDQVTEDCMLNLS